MVSNGTAYYKAHGRDALLRKIRSKDPEYYRGALYLHVRDAKSGVILAHPANPALIGKDLTDVPDTNGKKYRREILDLAATKGKGWVDYHYRNPETGKVEPKTTYIVRVDDMILESGIYKH